MGASQGFIDAQGYFTQNLPNVLHLGGNTFTFDFESLNQKFDLIFVDADHHYASVKNDTQKVLSLLKDENSIIVWHDYAYGTEKPRWDVLAGILDGMPANLHGKLYHVSNTMCAIYTSRNLKSKTYKGYEEPDKVFEIGINVKGK